MRAEWRVVVLESRVACRHFGFLYTNFVLNLSLTLPLRFPQTLPSGSQNYSMTRIFISRISTIKLSTVLHVWLFIISMYMATFSKYFPLEQK